MQNCSRWNKNDKTHGYNGLWCPQKILYLNIIEEFFYYKYQGEKAFHWSFKKNFAYLETMKHFSKFVNGEEKNSTQPNHKMPIVPKFQITGTTVMMPGKIKHGILNATTWRWTTRQTQRREYWSFSTSCQGRRWEVVSWVLYIHYVSNKSHSEIQMSIVCSKDQNHRSNWNKRNIAPCNSSHRT